MNCWKKQLNLLVLASVLCFHPLFAESLVEVSSKLMDQAWRVRELSMQVGDSAKAVKDYEKERASWILNSRAFAKQLVAENRWEEFSQYYKGLDQQGKQNLEFVVKEVVEKLFTASSPETTPLRKTQDYFPGYGYGKPGYIYRRGRELERSFLYSYWKDEEVNETTSKSEELVIDVKIAWKLKVTIPELVVGTEFNLDIDGKAHRVVKVKFNREVKIHSKQKHKMSLEKVWFKLFEAKKRWWGDPDWTLVGKTFQHKAQPTGESVLVEAEVVTP
jgi:hypothetical protein